MNEFLFEDFISLKAGDEITFYIEHAGQVEQANWKHDRVVGDLIFGSVTMPKFPKLNELGIDAYLKRSHILAGHPQYVYFVGETIEVIGVSVSGGISRKPLITSEFPHPWWNYKKSEYKTVHFSRKELDKIGLWAKRTHEKSFEGSSTYWFVRWLKTHGLGEMEAFTLEFKNGGLRCSFDILKERIGFLSYRYRLKVRDYSFNSPELNSSVKNTRETETMCISEYFSTFDEFMESLDQSLDMVLIRNQVHLNENLLNASNDE